MLPRLSWQGVAQWQLAPTGNLPCEGDSSIVLRTQDWHEAIVSDLSFLFGAPGGFLRFLDQIQRCFRVLAAEELVFLAFEIVIVHKESLELLHKLTG